MPTTPALSHTVGSIYTNCVSYGEVIRPAKTGHDFNRDTGMRIVAQASKGFLRPPFGSRLVCAGTANEQLHITASSLQNGTIHFRGNKGFATTGILFGYGRATDGIQTWIGGGWEPGGTRISVYTMAAGTTGLRASSAFTGAASTEYNGMLSLQGGDVFLAFGGVTVTTTTSNTVTGQIGVWGNTGGNLNDFESWEGIFVDTTTETSATFVLQTLDAGSSLTFDAVKWRESLNGGNITCDVGVRANADDPISYTDSALTNPNGSTLAATRTGRYIDLRFNFTWSGSQRPGLYWPEIAILKGNNAGGGSGTTVYAGGGYGS